MNDFLRSLARVLLSLLMLGAGLVVAASLLAALLVLVAAWGLRAGWARLTGRPVMPFVMGIDPRAGFGRVFRQRAWASEPARQAPSAGGARLRAADVTDVEPREPQPRA